MLIWSLLKSSIRDETVLWWVVIFPAILFLVLYGIFGGSGGDGVSQNIGVHAPVWISLPLKVFSLFLPHNIHFEFYADEENAIQDLKEEKVDVVVSYDTTTHKIVISYTPINQKGAVLALYLRKLMSDSFLSVDKDRKIKVVKSKRKGEDLYTPMVALIPLLVGYLFVPPLFTSMIKEGRFRRFMLMGLSPATVVFSSLVVALVVSFLSALVITAIGAFLGTHLLSIKGWLMYAVVSTVYILQGLSLLAFSSFAEGLGSLLYFLNLFAGGAVMPSTPLSAFLPFRYTTMWLSYDMKGIGIVLAWTLLLLVPLIIRGRKVFAVE